MTILTFTVGFIAGIVFILVILTMYRAKVVHEEVRKSHDFFQARLKNDEMMLDVLERLVEGIFLKEVEWVKLR